VRYPKVYRPTRKRSSVPPTPPSPILKPQRLPSIAQSTKSSWRLSFTSDRRGEHLRKLSQGAAVPITLKPEELVSNVQPLNRWLRSQGLRSSSQAIASSSDSTNLESLVSHLQTYCGSQDFGGRNDVEDASAAIHLHEMGISQQLASRGLQSSSSSPQLSNWGSQSHQHDVSSISGAARLTHNSLTRYLRNTSDSVPLSERIPQSWGMVFEDGGSSFYPSTRNSVQPSPQISRLNLMSLLAGNRNKVDVTKPKGEGQTQTKKPQIES